MQEAFNELGIDNEEIIVVPFSDELPDFTQDDKTNIYYGSTTLMNNIYEQLDKPKGLFYNHETYTMENYNEQWGEHMLNSEAAEIITVKEFIENRWDGPDQIKMFVRPNGDGKEFDGTVGFENDLRDMLERMMAYEGPMNMDSKILVGPAYNIHREWRNYIVGGKVVTSSRYRNNFKLSKSSTDIPKEMLTFVEERCKEYMPHENFAMDIAEVTHDDGNKYFYIIECGCLNSVGFYSADIKKLIKAITESV
jgi:hypothetical protein